MGIYRNLNRFLPCSTLLRVSPKDANNIYALVGIVGFLKLTTTTAVFAACLCTYTPVTLVEVLDGSTIIFNIKGEVTTVRLAGVDTPKLKQQRAGTWCESEGAKALQAKQFANKLLLDANEITLDEKETTPTGEMTAVVYVDNLSLGQELLYKFLATESSEPAPWCN